MITHRTLPKFIADRGGVALRPGDGIIHSWLNRMLLPDEVGTGAVEDQSSTNAPIIFPRKSVPAPNSNSTVNPKQFRVLSLEFEFQSPTTQNLKTLKSRNIRNRSFP